MNILILNGSPRGERSGTLRMARAFAAGTSATTVREMHLSTMNIRPCRGCFSCWTATPGKCVIRDDMEAVLAAVRESDIVIESFPLFFFGMPSTLKALTDRCLPLAEPYSGALFEGGTFHRFHDASLLAKRLVIVSSCGYAATEGMYDALTAQLARICHGKVPLMLTCPEGELLTQMGERRQVTAYLELLTRAGAEFAAVGALSDETRAALERPILSQKAFASLTGHRWYNSKD